MSDIAIGISTPDGWKLISYFNVMTETLFTAYHARGIGSRNDMIISEEARDTDPLNCNGEDITNTDNIDNWVILN